MLKRFLAVLCTLAMFSCSGEDELECGPGTTDVDGRCVSSQDGACGPGTVLGGDGECVVDSPVSCGPGTQRDATTNACVPTELDCGADTTFDEASGGCVPTETACGEGTVFNEGLGVCTPEATCQPGDVVLDGFCVDPAEALAADPDVVGEENDDPAFGGAPNQIDLPPVGADVVFTGTIGEPVDLDGDMAAEQDVDTFAFEAEPRQWFALSLQAIDAPPTAFVVEGPTGSQYQRYSPAGDTAVARTFMTTVPGTYTITVAPASVFLAEEVPPHGDDDFDYVGALERREEPQGTLVNLASGHEGMLSETALLYDPGFLPNSFGQFSIDDWGDATAALSFWHDGELQASRNVIGEVAFPVVVPQTGQLTFVLDYVRITGGDLSYHISGSQGSTISAFGQLSPDETVDADPVDLDAFESQFYTFSVEPGQIVEFSQDNQEAQLASLELFDAAGQILFDVPLEARSTGFGNVWTYWPSLDGGSFLLRARAGGARSQFTVRVASTTPTDFGELTPGAEQTEVVPLLQADRSRFVTVGFSDGDVAELSQDNLGDARVSLRLHEDDWTDVEETIDLADRSGVSLPKYEYRFDLRDVRLVEIHNETSGDVSDLGVRFNAVTPEDLGALVPSDEVVRSEPGAVPASRKTFFQTNLTEEAILEGTARTNDGDVDFSVLDPLGGVVFSSQTPGVERFLAVLQPGNYLLEVDAAAELPTGWDLDVSLVGFPSAQEVEPNETVSDASAGLTPGGDIRAVTSNNDVDHFAFDVSMAQNYSFRQVTIPPLPLAISVLDDNGGLLSNTTVGSGGFTRTFLEPGTYHVKVVSQGISASSTEYILSSRELGTTADVADAGGNDAAAFGTPADPGSGYTIEGAITGSSDVDWYSFDLPQALDLYVSATGITQRFTSVALDFRDDALSSLPLSDSVVSLPAGTSHLRVAGFAPGFHNYRIEFDDPPLQVESSPGVDLIVDGWPSDVVTDTITVLDSCVIDRAMIDVEIPHTFIGDLHVVLQAPDGTSVSLWDGMGGSGTDLIGTFPTTLSPDEDLATLTGRQAQGDWTLAVGDTNAFDTGRLERWALIIFCQ